MGEGGRLVIPAEFRRELGLTPGAVVVISETGDGDLRISTPAAGLRRARALVSRYVQPGDSLTDELLAERRHEAARD
jgi:AbrB family looped-hinge helix DNA binding protein